MRKLYIIYISIGSILTLIGLAGIPEDIRAWTEWIVKIFDSDMDIITINQNTVRWILFIIGGIIIFIYSGTLKKITISPFILELPEQGHFREFITQNYISKTILIKGFNNLFPSSIVLKVRPRKIKIFKQISIKFEEKRRSRGFWKLRSWYRVNAPKDVVSIEEMLDLNIQNELLQYSKTHIADRHKTVKSKYAFETLIDSNRGIIGQYTPSYDCPKGASLLLQIKPRIQVKEKWKGYINFKHIRGDDYQSYARLPIKIIHKEVPL